jgi:hypothetical protein
MTKIMH